MSQLQFKTKEILEKAKEVKDEIIKDRTDEATTEWNDKHAQGFFARLLRLPAEPVPPVDKEWLQKQIDNNFLYGESLKLSENMINYCSREDAPETITLSASEARRLWLI